MTGSVLIDDMPVPLDWRHQVRDFLDLRLPSQDILFARHCHQRPINPLVCDNAPDYLRPPYPPLPPIEIGEYQCPTGMSRYGRALFLVDWKTLEPIAIKCWNRLAVEVNPESLDVPLDWKTVPGNHYLESVSLKFVHQFSAPGSQFVYHIQKMFPLAPYRIPGRGSALWALPLVDRRYFMHGAHEPSEDEEPPGDWNALFDALAESLGIPDAGFDRQILQGEEVVANYGEVPAAYGSPDERLYDTRRPQPAAALIDAAALSVGKRIVYDPVSDTFRLLDANESTGIRIRRLADPSIPAPPDTEPWPDETTPTSPLMIAGGRRGAAAYPSVIKAWYRVDGESKYSDEPLPGGGISFPSPNVWTSWDGDDQEAADSFVTQLAADIRSWLDSGGQYCFAGILPKVRVIPGEESEDPPEDPPEPIIVHENVCGFDDYISIRIKEHDEGQYALTTRFYELPPLFLPSVILAGGKRDDCGGGGGSNEGGNEIALLEVLENGPSLWDDFNGLGAGGDVWAVKVSPHQSFGDFDGPTAGELVRITNAMETVRNVGPGVRLWCFKDRVALNRSFFNWERYASVQSGTGTLPVANQSQLSASGTEYLNGRRAWRWSRSTGSGVTLVLYVWLLYHNGTRWIIERQDTDTPRVYEGPENESIEPIGTYTAVSPATGTVTITAVALSNQSFQTRWMALPGNRVVGARPRSLIGPRNVPVVNFPVGVTFSGGTIADIRVPVTVSDVTVHGVPPGVDVDIIPITDVADPFNIYRFSGAVSMPGEWVLSISGMSANRDAGGPVKVRAVRVINAVLPRLFVFRLFTDPPDPPPIPAGSGLYLTTLLGFQNSRPVWQWTHEFVVWKLSFIDGNWRITSTDVPESFVGPVDSMFGDYEGATGATGTVRIAANL